MSVAEINLLSELVQEVAKHSGPIVEIGTLVGRTTTEIAIADSERHQIITVDNYSWNPWRLTPDQHSASADQVLRYLSSKKLVDRRNTDKKAFFREYDGAAPSLVFLDAMHTYEETKLDIEWAQSVKAQVICGHDYSSDWPGVMQIVDELGGPSRLADTLWVL
ncbi:MAG: class I SAM-dependent methyltransferase [Planctomycetota bacterium]